MVDDVLAENSKEEKRMYARLRRWWATGSPLWQRLVVCGTLTIGAFVAGQTVAILGGRAWLSLGLAAVAAAALCVGAFLLMMARARGEHVYSPRWYRKFQQDARARAAGNSQ
ncbi:hypothetical protein [Streptomyces xanthii]|nr:hypothetical protein [Streptomyces xanthii]